MRFLLMAGGLNAANSKYSCLYCKIDKAERGDMSKDLQYYNSLPMVRTLDTMCQIVNKKSKQNCGCVNQPLLSVGIDKIVVDEVRLMRIGDILIRNLIENAVRSDHKENIGGGGSTNQKNRTMDIVVKCINSCGGGV